MPRKDNPLTETEYQNGPLTPSPNKTGQVQKPKGSPQQHGPLTPSPVPSRKETTPRTV